MPMAAISQSYKISEITDPSDLVSWTKATYDSFVNTDNVLFETIVNLPPGAMPSQSKLDSDAREHQSDLTKRQTDGGENKYIQILDPETGAIMGGAKWTFFAATPKREEQLPEVTWIDDSTPDGKFDRTFTQAVMDEFNSRRFKHMACPHALLYICFTTPKYERRGVSTALVRWGIERADKEGWPCFTEASPRGTPVYARLDFQTREILSLRWDERGEAWKAKGDVRWTFMERPAVTAGKRLKG